MLSCIGKGFAAIVPLTRVDRKIRYRITYITKQFKDDRPGNSPVFKILDNIRITKEEVKHARSQIKEEPATSLQNFSYS